MGGISWKQKGEGILVDIFSQFVQDVFNLGGDVILLSPFVPGISASV